VPLTIGPRSGHRSRGKNGRTAGIQERRVAARASEGGWPIPRKIPPGDVDFPLSVSTSGRKRESSQSPVKPLGLHGICLSFQALFGLGLHAARPIGKAGKGRQGTSMTTPRVGRKLAICNVGRVMGPCCPPKLRQHNSLTQGQEGVGGLGTAGRHVRGR